MNSKGILIVDDDEDYREYLVEELSKDYLIVAGAASGKDAMAILGQNPGDFQFAVVDHKLESEPDGIETTKRLVEIAPQLYPVVFSNVRVDTSPLIMEYKYRALEAGAYRYLGWKEDDPKKDIHDFVKEIEQLAALRDWISEFFLARAAAPSLLTQLDVGMAIIDRHCKVWFLNEAMRRITGAIGPDLPKSPCVYWHGYKHYPCQGCQVIKTLKDGESHVAFLLSPFVSRDNDRVFFLKVWTQPVTDQKGNIVNADDGKPLAVMKSVQELTNSPELKAMQLSERLQIIADAILGIEKQPFSENKRFQYSRIYVVNGGGEKEDFVLTAAEGDQNPDLLHKPIELRKFDGENLKTAEDNMKNTGCGYGFSVPLGFDPVLPAKQRTPYIYFPIIENNKTVALIEVGCNHIEEKTDALLKPYAREVRRAIQDDQAKIPEYIVIAAKDIAEIERKLQIKTSPEDQLRTIAKSICEKTNSHQYIIRYVEGDVAKLVRLKVSELCEYENVARPRTPLSHMQSWSCRTISARAENLADIIHDRKVIEEFRDHLDDPSREALQEANALCYEPLILDGICIGMMGFHNRNANAYKDKKNITIVRLLVKPATMALHDYMTEQESREKAEADALSDTLTLVLHNIKTPLAASRFAAKRFLNKVEAACVITPEMKELIDDFNAHLSRISHLRDEVLKLKGTKESRVELIVLEDFIHKTVKGAVAVSEEVIIEYTLEFKLRKAFIDRSGMKLCLEVLLQNAIDAMKDNQGEKRLNVILRDASDFENRMIESPHLGLAVDVVDNGSGVPEEISKGLFRKMASRKPKGLGMGLLHCQAFAHSAQGTVYYDDTQKNGAKFTLIFPYQRRQEKK